MIYRMAWEVIALAVSIIHDFYLNVPDWFRITRKRHIEVLDTHVSTARSDADFTRTAIVATYLTEDSLPFTINLLVALRRSQFYLLVLSTRRLSAEMIERLLPHCDQIIQRRPIGRDFGSYQMGLQLLRDWGVYDRIDTLVLANDSMFYQSSFSSVVAEVVSAAPTWATLFENYEYHYHAQSFFQVFGRPALGSEAFKRFWACYWPLSSRPYAIDKGEVRLSYIMRRAGFKPTAYYTSNRLINALRSWMDSNNDLSSLHHVLHAQFGGAFMAIVQPVKSASSVLMQPGSVRREPLLDVDALPQIVKLVSERTERFNPTHSVGVLANFLCGAPLKRDIVYRGFVTMAEVLQLACGYSDNELPAMETDLRARGNPAMFHGLEKMLYHRGRI